jgi:hypothetical protein
MPTPISLLIAYPKELIRAGLPAMLDTSRINVVAETEDALDTPKLVRKFKPNVFYGSCNDL